MVLWALLFVSAMAASSSTSCKARDCSEERAGQVRCVANRSELCNPDGTLTYDNCNAQGLFCSEDKGGCVTEEILNTGGRGGEGGSSANAGGSTSGTGGTGG